jgi:hypothetical protein
MKNREVAGPLTPAKEAEKGFSSGLAGFLSRRAHDFHIRF